MATGVRPGLSRREQEKARKKIQRHADTYITLLHSFITGEPVKPQGYNKPVMVIAGNSRDAKGIIDIYRAAFPDFDGRFIIWSPSQHKATQEQLNKIIPNLKTVEVAENRKDAENLVSSTPVEEKEDAQKSWVDKHKPENVIPMDGHKR